MTLLDGVDGDVISVQANGSGDISLETTRSSADIVVNAAVVTGTGDISALAQHDVVLNQQLRTSQIADTTISLEATEGAIRESASAAVIGNKLTLRAHEYAHLHDARVSELLSAQVGSNGTLDNSFQLRNAAANQIGDDFVDEVTATVTGLSPFDQNAIRSQHLFENRFGGNYALYLVNQGHLDVYTVDAGIPASITPNVYIETSGDSTLTIKGDVETVSTSVEEGGIVLVAGGAFTLDGGQLLTQSAARNQLIHTIGSGTDVVGAHFFNGGEGIELDNPNLTSTKFVLRQTALVPEDFRSHQLQRVAMQFGFAGELGFEAIVAYADGRFQPFNVRGEEGVPGALSGDQRAILAEPKVDLTDAAIFTRNSSNLPTSGGIDFLDANVNLPTHAVLRRATDFFIVQHAGDPAKIQDLTVETQEIKDVKSLGEAGALPLPEDPERPNIPYVAPDPVFVIAEPPPPPPTAEMELPFTREQNIEVVIYQVKFKDANQNGQVESFELPTFREVMEFRASEEFDSIGNRVRTVDATGGKEPSQADIDRAKAELRIDPDQPSGSYAIVKESSESDSVVLDVFGIRDWPEDPSLQQEVEDNTELVLPMLKPFHPDASDQEKPETEDLPPPADSTDLSNSNARWSFRPSQEQVLVNPSNSRLASAGLLAGSLLMLRHRETQIKATVQTGEVENIGGVFEPVEKVGFSRAARRRRALTK